MAAVNVNNIPLVVGTQYNVVFSDDSVEVLTFRGMDAEGLLFDGRDNAIDRRTITVYDINTNPNQLMYRQPVAGGKRRYKRKNSRKRITRKSSYKQKRNRKE